MWIFLKWKTSTNTHIIDLWTFWDEKLVNNIILMISEHFETITSEKKHFIDLWTFLKWKTSK